MSRGTVAGYSSGVAGVRSANSADNWGVGAESGAGFGPVLRRLRMAAGLSQEALAERAGLSPDGIAALERGRRTRPRAFTVGVLADALALGPADRALLASAATSQARPGDLLGRPLPVWLTSFVGRQQELAEVERWLGRVRQQAEPRFEPAAGFFRSALVGREQPQCELGPVRAG